VAERYTYELAVEPHGGDQPGGDVLELLDRRLGIEIVEGLQQLRGFPGRATVDQEADTEIGAIEACLPQEPILQGIGVKRSPGDVGIRDVPPGLCQISGRACCEAGLVNPVGEDAQGFTGGACPPHIQSESRCTERQPKRSAPCHILYHCLLPRFVGLRLAFCSPGSEPGH
jgi:hypothetical protein